MALPAILAVQVGRSILVGGTKHAVKKYGDDVVKQVQKTKQFKKAKKEDIALKKQRVADSKAPKKEFPEYKQSAAEKAANRPSQMRAKETQKVNNRNRRIEEERINRDRFDIDGDPLDEVPLRFDMSIGGLLNDDRNMYRGGGGPGIEALREEAPEVVERMGYSIGGAILKIAKKFKNKAQTKTNKIIDESEKQMKLDNLDAFDYEEAASMYTTGDMTLAKVNQTLKAAGYPTKDVEDFVFILSDSKGKSPSALLKDRKDIIKKQESKKNPDGMTDAELEKEYDRLSEEFAVDNSRFEMQNGGLLSDDRNTLYSGGAGASKKRMDYEEGGMLSDNDMEENYSQFIVEEALTEEEEDMLMNKLEQDEQLAMLFDKVVDVAQEFAGSGPVEGPGTGVSDSIPARLSDGEFVFTAKAVAEIGEDTLMSMMKDAEANADERQGFAMGGVYDEEEIKDEESDVSDDMRKVNPRLNPNVR